MDSKFFKVKLFQVIIRIMLGIVFIWAGSGKIFDPEGFAKIIQNYLILPSFLINPAAIILPWLEFSCGLMLISGYFVKGSALIVNLLMIIFMSAFIINIFRGIDVSCGCFSLSIQETKSLYLYLIRDGLILLAGFWLLYYQLNSDEF